MSKLKNCKTCSKEVAKSAKSCPHCGAKLKMGFFPKALIGIGALIVIGLFVNGSDDETASTSTEPTTSAASSEKAPAALSNEGVSSDVKIKVESFDSAESLGDNEFNKVAAQGIFKVAKVTITNGQKDAVTLDSTSFKLVDDQKREFGTSTEGHMALETSAEKKESFFLKQLNPGLSLTGYVVFDVPKDAKGFVLQARGGMTGKQIDLKVE